MYKNHNNKKNSSAPYLISKKRNFTLNIFLQKIRENKKVTFFDHPLNKLKCSKTP